MTTHNTTEETISILAHELRQRDAELAILNSVQEGLASRLDIQSIYKLVGDKIRATFNAQVVSIDTYDRAAQLLHSRYYFEGGKSLPGTTYACFGFRKHVIEKCLPLVINSKMSRWMEEYDNPVNLGLQPKSAIFVPMIVGEETIGVISLQNNDQENAFTEANLRLLTTLANSMSVALENARLFDETQRLLKETEQRNAELAIINSVQDGLASKLAIQAIYDLVGDRLRDVFHDKDVEIRIYDAKTNVVHNPYTYENGQRITVGSFSLPERGFGPHVLHTLDNLLVNENLAQEMEKYGSRIVTGTQMAKSLMMVPLVVNGLAHGLITVSDMQHEHAFKESDVRLLQTLANSMGVALESARLFDETQQRNSELAIINSVQEGLVTHLDFNSIIHLVGGKLGEIFDVSTIQINIYDRAKNLMHIPYCFEEGDLHTHGDVDLDAPHWFISHMKQIIKTKQTVIINENTLEVARQRGGPTEPPKGAKWSLCMVGVPLIAKGEATGVIWLMDNYRENVFTESMVRLLQTLANSMSVALENARLWEQEKMFRRALQRELEIGREIQAGFLPEALPQVEGWEIAASLMSAREVAGDFYDAFELPDGTIGLVIADVCDKGVGAALFMTLFRSLIRATANLDYFEHSEVANSPHSTPERLKRAMSLTNNYIAETHGDSGMFATLFFGILDPRNGTLTYINGGHEPPLIVRSGTVRETLYKTGPAVGVVMDCHFDLRETQLNTNDMFFAFTDGVPDCMDPNGESFGRERLLDILGHSDESLHELVKNIETVLRHYIANATQFDDITLLAVRRSEIKVSEVI